MGSSTTPQQRWDRPETGPETVPVPGPVPAPLRLYGTAVQPEWVDYNGHMSEWCYLLVMGESSDAFFRYVGIDDDYRASGASLFTVETHIRNLREVSEGAELSLTLQVLGVDAKRVHLAHELIGPDGSLVATGEQLLVHVDLRAAKVSLLPVALLGRLQQIADAHAALAWPDWVGHVMGIPSQGEGAARSSRKAGAAWTSS